MIGSIPVKFRNGLNRFVPAGLSNRVVYPVFAVAVILMNKYIDDGHMQYTGAGTFEVMDYDPEEYSAGHHRKIGELQAFLSILPTLVFIVPIVYLDILPEMLALIAALFSVVMAPLSLPMIGNVTVEVVEV